MRPLFLNALVLGTLVISTAVVAQDTAVTADAQSEPPLAYEIVVTPNISRARLRSLIVEVEDDFWARFNELNIDDLYDVVCFEFTPTMSHISRRTCEPNFYILAKSNNAGDALFSLGVSTSSLGMGKGIKTQSMLLSQPGLRREVEEEFKILQEKMEDFTRTDTQFRNIGGAWADLKARLANFGDD